jgi:hypothetical protein
MLYLRFRGSKKKYQVNNPILLHQNRKCVTMKQAKRDYGFLCIVLYESTVYENAAGVESLMQQILMDMGIQEGVRLWRWSGKGGYTEAQKSNPKHMFKVFLTYTKIENISNLVVNRTKRKRFSSSIEEA